MKKMMYLLIFCICFIWGGFTVRAETYGDYEYSINKNNTLTITKYNGTKTDVIIPDTIHGLQVTVIGENAFKKNIHLESLVIGKYVVEIESHAFYVCENLAEITMPDTLEKIGAYAFVGNAIKTLILPSALKETEVEFFYSSILEEIIIKNNRNGYYTEDGVLYKDTKLLLYPVNKEGEIFVIPNGITEIGPCAFSGNKFQNLRTLIIPSTVETLSRSCIGHYECNLTVIFAHTDILPCVGLSVIEGGENSVIKVKSEAIKQNIEDNWLLSQFKGTIVVDASPMPTTNLTFLDGTTEKHMDMELTTTYQCEWNMEPYGASDSVMWTSSNSSVATVGMYSGLVQCVGEGTAIITGMDEHGHTVTLNVKGYVNIIGFEAATWESWSGIVDITRDIEIPFVYDIETSYQVLYYLDITWEVFKEKVSNNTNLKYDFIDDIEIINTNPEIMEVVYSEKESISDTQQKRVYNIDVKSLGTSTIYARIKNYDGTIYETPRVTYSVYMDIDDWDRYSVEGEWIEIFGIEEYDALYTGKAHTPKPVIINRYFDKNGEILVEGVDYTLIYENNMNAGTGRCIVEGIGNYKKKFDIPFTIKSRNIQECNISWNEDTESTEIKDGKKVLIKNVDYRSDIYIDYYKDGTMNTTDSELLVSEIITAMGNYSGTAKLEYYIVNPKYEHPKKYQTLSFNLMSRDTILNAKLHDIFNNWLMYDINEQVDFDNLIIDCKSQTDVSYRIVSVFGNPTAATIGADGKITVYSTGEVFIEICAEETDEYCEKSEIVILNIMETNNNLDNNGNNIPNDNANNNLDNNANNIPNDNANNTSNNLDDNVSNNSDKNISNNLGSANDFSTGSGSTGISNSIEKNNHTMENSTAGNMGMNTRKSQTIVGTSAYKKIYNKNGKFYLNCKAKTTLTYTSSNLKVATVSSMGKVTIKGIGICTITVRAKATTKYQSTVKCITITVQPKKIQLTSIKSNKKKSITVKWKKEKTVSGYEIQYATNKNFKNAKKVIVKSSKDFVAINNLKAGKKYYIRLRAYIETVRNRKIKCLYGIYTEKIAVRIKE